jgi:hypothetical protein
MKTSTPQHSTPQRVNTSTQATPHRHLSHIAHAQMYQLINPGTHQHQDINGSTSFPTHQLSYRTHLHNDQLHHKLRHQLANLSTSTTLHSHYLYQTQLSYGPIHYFVNFCDQQVLIHALKVLIVIFFSTNNYGLNVNPKNYNISVFHIFTI